MKNVIIIFLVFYSTILNKVYSQWSDVSLGTNSVVDVFYVDSASNLLFVGGQFSAAGGKNINSIATWDGSEWNAFGNNEVFSSPGVVSAIVNYNGSIIVGGDFDSIGMTRVNNIARWNGSEWESLGNGFDDSVNDLIIFKGELYACGSFYYSGTDYVNAFAKWNGTNWLRVANIYGYANSFTIYNDNLIISGSFYHQNINSIGNIMSWTGADVDSTLAGFNNTVIRVKSYNDTLIAVGSFTFGTSNNSNYVSIYYNQSWHSIGNPTGGQNWITDAIKYYGELYLCGYFYDPPDLCRYNGSGFDSVADVIGFFKVLSEYKGELYAGGLFRSLNGIAIKNIARFNKNINSISTNELLSKNFLSIWPNPSTDGKIFLEFESIYKVNTINIKIYSITGQLVYSDYLNNVYSNILNIDISQLHGLFYISCTVNNKFCHVQLISAI